MQHEIINKDPFAEARLTRILDDKGKGTDKFMVYIEDPNSPTKDFVPIPGQNTIHSPEYEFVQNAAIHEMALEVMHASGVQFQPIQKHLNSKTDFINWNGKRFCARWYTEEIKIKSPQGTDVILGIEARNSYDKSCKAGISFFAMHLICANQFHSSNLLGTPFEFSHAAGASGSDGVADSIAGATERLIRTAEQFSTIAPKLGLLATTRCDTFDQLRRLRSDMSAMTGFTFSADAIIDELEGHGVTANMGIIGAEAGGIYGDPNTYWAILNAITAITTHKKGGPKSGGYSARAVDFLIKAAERSAA